MAPAHDIVERLRLRLSGEMADPELCAVADKLSLRQGRWPGRSLKKLGLLEASGKQPPAFMLYAHPST
jgi:hypothetical protein